MEYVTIESLQEIPNNTRIDDRSVTVFSVYDEKNKSYVTRQIKVSDLKNCIIASDQDEDLTSVVFSADKVNQMLSSYYESLNNLAQDVNDIGDFTSRSIGEIMNAINSLSSATTNTFKQQKEYNEKTYLNKNIGGTILKSIAIGDGTETSTKEVVLSKKSHVDPGDIYKSYYSLYKSGDNTAVRLLFKNDTTNSDIGYLRIASDGILTIKAPSTVIDSNVTANTITSVGNIVQGGRDNTSGIDFKQLVKNSTKVHGVKIQSNYRDEGAPYTKVGLYNYDEQTPGWVSSITFEDGKLTSNVDAYAPSIYATKYSDLVGKILVFKNAKESAVPADVIFKVAPLFNTSKILFGGYDQTAACELLFSTSANVTGTNIGTLIPSIMTCSSLMVVGPGGSTESAENTKGTITTKQINCVTCSQSSSMRYKTNVVDLNKEKSVKTIKSLRAVEYDYTSSKTHDKGFIAEEVAEIDDTNVIYNEDGLPDGLDYSKFTPDIINALQYYMDKVDKLEEAIKELKSN